MLILLLLSRFLRNQRRNYIKSRGKLSRKIQNIEGPVIGERFMPYRSFSFFSLIKKLRVRIIRHVDWGKRRAGEAGRYFTRLESCWYRGCDNQPYPQGRPPSSLFNSAFHTFSRAWPPARKSLIKCPNFIIIILLAPSKSKPLTTAWNRAGTVSSLLSKPF